MATSSPSSSVDIETEAGNEEDAHEASSLLAQPQDKGDTNYKTDTLSSRQDDTSNSNNAPSSKFQPPPRNYCHLLFIFLSIYSLVASACLAVTQLIPPSSDHNLGILHLILRIYVCLACVMFCFTELEVPFVLERNGLSNWLVRGYVYSFVGLVGTEEPLSALPANQKYKPSFKGQTILFFTWLASAALVIAGFLYLVFGLLLMKQLRDKIRRDYETKVQGIKSTWNSKEKEGVSE